MDIMEINTIGLRLFTSWQTFEMTRLFAIIFLGLTLTACGQENTFDQEIWLETKSMTIYDSSKENPYSGKLTGNKEGKEFYGTIKNGKPAGTCYWLRHDSDTIQILKFKKGEKVFSQQFDQTGNRQGKAWTMQFVETSKSDEKLISKVVDLLLKQKIDSLKSFYRPSSIVPETELLISKTKKIIEESGDIIDFEIFDIQKRKYSHRNEFYIEAQIILKAKKDDLKYNVRLLTDNEIINSINFWKRESELVKNEFIKPDFYFFLKM